MISPLKARSDSMISKNTRCAAFTVTIVFCAALLPKISQILAAELKGKVVGVEGQVVRISSDSEQVPNVGDPVEIYFQIPGLSDSVQIGTGKVTETNQQFIMATIDNLKGKLSRNQLARMTSSAPHK